MHTHEHNDKADYIRRLDSEERVEWQRPEKVFNELMLTGSEVVTDLGAGTGFFAFRFAKALPMGRVMAVDVDPDMIEYMQHKQQTEQLENLTFHLASSESPVIDPYSHVVFVNNVLHHIEHPTRWLRSLHEQMRRGSKLMILEFMPGELPVGPPDDRKISPKEVKRVLEGSGFGNYKLHEGVLPYQHIYMVTR